MTVSDNLSQTHNESLYSDNTEVVRNIIMEEIVEELRTALSIEKIYTVRQSVEAYDKQSLELGIQLNSCNPNSYNSNNHVIRTIM